MKISILGSGAYGMAIASVLHYNKHSIKMWTNSNEEANYLNANRRSPKVNYDIPSDIIISTRDIHNLWLSKYGNDNCLKIGWEHNFHNNNQKYK